MMRSAAIRSARGEVWIWLSDSMSPFSSAMYSAADVPLPDTSAISTPSRCSSMREQIVVVAADLARGHAERRHRKPRHLQGPLRQQRHLDLAGDAQFLLEALLLGGLAQQILDAGRHRVERLRELAELVLRGHGDLVGEVARAGPARCR